MIDGRKLIRRLQDAGILSAEDAERATTQVVKGGNAYTVLRKEQGIPDAVIGQVMADMYSVPFVDLTKRNIQEKTLRIVPEIIARNQRVIPFRQDDLFIDVAFADPDRIDLAAAIAKLTKKQVRPFFATEENIASTLSLFKSHLDRDLKDIITTITPTGEHIIKLLDTLLQYAFANRASDIHVEPQEQAIIIRFRIDGELHDVADLPKIFLDELMTRIKVLAHLRTDEHRSAQDGRFSFDFDGDVADVRVSIIPMTKGERAALRILSDRARSFSLEELGLSERQLEIITRNMRRPYGMILATGPTGAGKTSTLYAIIKELNSRDVNISTIEDPVEYEIDGVNQIQVNQKTNLTFANGLKSILRQDPDVIMVGEIRDEETARIAINAAMTGHLVLSTLHTNDAATTLPRLLDMHIEPFLIASTVNLAIAQRLVRKIHQSCMESYTPDEAEWQRLIAPLSPQERTELGVDRQHIRFFKARGCDICHKTGFEGRIGIFEFLELDETMRQLIMRRAHADDIRAAQKSHGMHSMYFDGLQKVLAGKTTIEEVLKTTQL